MKRNLMYFKVMNKQKEYAKKFRLGLICGGPSLERGISLNSARSVLDHLEDENIEICPIYFDTTKRSYLISTDQLYSNTPSDFDFKLKQTGQLLDRNQLIKYLQKMDLVFPVMHGQFGEDGEIQTFLEKNKIPFIGTGSESCKKAFDKYIANEFIHKLGFFTLPSAVLKIYKNDHKKIIQDFFKTHNIERAVVKPASGGSSIGVFSVTTPEEALEKVDLLFSKRMDTRVVIEQFATGSEFTVIVLQNRFNLPTAILPTEIETDYTENQIFDYRRKYLPTRQVKYHCPPRFDDNVIEKIQLQAEQLFSAFGMKDFARMDGWLLPDGNIWFSDINPVSGMEQNSFLFQQSSRIGFTHRSFLHYIINEACKKRAINFPNQMIENNNKRKTVNVLFGGRSSERQVSLMSGTNVWLKLRQSKIYNPQPFLLTPDYNVWEIPYSLTLNHTVEEIIENCQHATRDEARLEKFEQKVRAKLLLEDNYELETFFPPKIMTLKEFIKKSPFVFIGLHGGIGENGFLQELLEQNKVLFNGCNSKVSRLCNNKKDTGQLIKTLEIEGLKSTTQKLIAIKDLPKNEKDLNVFWKNMCRNFETKSLIIKPNDDGCSSGIVHLFSAFDLQRYLDILKYKLPFIPNQTFKNQTDAIELPLDPIKEILFEKFVETDIVRIKKNELIHKKKTGWVEITIGILEKNGIYQSMNPSITISKGEVLSVEEKFQGGTGINLTPPPESIIKPKTLEKTKKLIEILSEKVGLKNYARIDAFVNTKTGDLIVIEVNTLPGLTPSTVFFHQGLAENPQLFPKELLEKIIQNTGY